jgi:hypothetical protein
MRGWWRWEVSGLRKELMLLSRFDGKKWPAFGKSYRRVVSVR